MCAEVCMWRPEDNFWELVLFPLFEASDLLFWLLWGAPGGLVHELLGDSPVSTSHLAIGALL